MTRKRGILLTLSFLAVAAVGLAGGAGPRLAIAKPITNIQGESIADVTERVLPSVVSIAVKANRPAHMTPFGPGQMFNFGPSIPQSGLGSGVIVSADGYILTNNHVVDGAETIEVQLADGRDFKAKVVGTDPKTDVAVVRLEKKVKGLKPLAFGSSAKLRLGEVVLAIGNPMGVGQSVTMGIVSAKGRGGRGLVDYGDFIQTDAAINPGNSGGALVNMKGELVGINTAIMSRSGGSQGIGFAIPSDMAEPIMKMLIKSGRVTRGYLGVSIQQVNEDIVQTLKLKLPEEHGVLVTDVLDGTAADKAGLKRDDVVIAVNGDATPRAEQFRNLIASQGAGAVVTLDVIRNGTRLQIPVKLGKLPEERALVGKAPSGDKTNFGVQVAPVDGRARRQYDLPRDLSYGLVVTGVEPGSRADELGLRPGDVLLEVNRQKIRSASDFKKAYGASRDKLAVLLYRDGMTSYIVVTK